MYLVGLGSEKDTGTKAAQPKSHRQLILMSINV